MSEKYNILCCTECDSRLENGYCRACNFSPSMQDTYVKQLTLEELLEEIKQWITSPDGQEAILDSHNRAMKMVKEMFPKRHAGEYPKYKLG